MGRSFPWVGRSAAASCLGRHPIHAAGRLPVLVPPKSPSPCPQKSVILLPKVCYILPQKLRYSATQKPVPPKTLFSYHPKVRSLAVRKEE